MSTLPPANPSSTSPLELIIVGIGRLGGTAARILERKGHRVRRVHRGEAIPRGTIVWLTVPDGEIAQTATRCPPEAVVLHASGASDLSVLAPLPRIGSLHPLMTFPGGTEPTGPVPAAIAGTPEAVAAARSLALALGWTAFEVPGDRRAYHAAAVIAGNFATTLLAEAASILEHAGVSAEAAPSLLAPLALQSVRNAAELGPAHALTGPVVRGDSAVIDDHRAVLKACNPATLAVYESLLRATRRLAATRSEDFHENGD